MTAELPPLFSLFSQSILVIPLNSVVGSFFFSLNQSLPQLSTKLTIAISDLSLGHTVVLGIGFSARRASEKVKAGRRSVRYCFVDASCSFTFDALPAGSLGRAYLRCSHLRLPLSLNLVQLTLLFALSWLTQG
jgi:hypothetical protein